MKKRLLVMLFALLVAASTFGIDVLCGIAVVNDCEALHPYDPGARQQCIEAGMAVECD